MGILAQHRCARVPSVALGFEGRTVCAARGGNANRAVPVRCGPFETALGRERGGGQESGVFAGPARGMQCAEVVRVHTRTACPSGALAPFEGIVLLAKGGSGIYDEQY